MNWIGLWTMSPHRGLRVGKCSMLPEPLRQKPHEFRGAFKFSVNLEFCVLFKFNVAVFATSPFRGGKIFRLPEVCGWGLVI